MTNTPQNPSVDFGFHAVIPRVIRTAYKHLTPVQKWLYVCLKDLCGDHGTCYRSLRALSEETDLSTGMLSESIADLHKAGLIHAEKKKRSTGGKEVWHITIVDIWQANGVAHPTKRSHSEPECSPAEQPLENVHTVNQNVHLLNRECSHSEPECSLCETEVITEKQEQTKAIPLKQEEVRDGAALADAPAHSLTDPQKNVTQGNGETHGDANRDRDTLPARIDPDPVQPLRAPQSALRDQDRAAPAQQSRSATRPAPDRQGKAPGVKPDLFESASPEIQAVITEWRAIFKKPIAITATLIEHATTLIAFQPEPGEIAQCRLWMYQTDAKKWYTQHGMHLGDVVKNFERFRSACDVPHVPEDPNFVNGRPRKYYSSFDRPDFDKAASEAEFYPVKPLVIRPEADYAATF